MAKHTKGKFISKQSRISCRHNLKPSNLDKNGLPVIKVSDSFNTAMRDAFIGAKVSAAIIGSKLVASVVNAASSNIGINKVGRGWTANISKRTFVQLQKDGVFA